MNGFIYFIVVSIFAVAIIRVIDWLQKNSEEDSSANNKTETKDETKS
jgi:hypothetical protein